jgi:hypothetical protein
MSLKRILTVAAATLVITLAVAFGFLRYQPQPVKAFNPQPDPPRFGIFGIIPGQTVRLNVVNTSPPDPNIPPPCRVVFTIRDANGNPFVRPNGTLVTRTMLLNAGESAFLQLNADNFPRTTDGRITVRPDASIQQADPINGYAPPCIPTVEVINNTTGRTQFVLNESLPAVQAAIPTN